MDVEMSSGMVEQDRQMLQSEAVRMMCAAVPTTAACYLSTPEDMAIAQFNHLKINAGPKYLSMKQQQQQMEYTGSPNSVTAFPQTPALATPLSSPTTHNK